MVHNLKSRLGLVSTAWKHIFDFSSFLKVAESRFVQFLAFNFCIGNISPVLYFTLQFNDSCRAAQKKQISKMFLFARQQEFILAFASF